MRHYSRWQTAAILGVALVVSLAAAPNLLPASARERLPAWAQGAFVLGMDLKGGERIVYEIDPDDMRLQTLATTRDMMRSELRSRRVQFTGLVFRQNGVEVRIREAVDMPRVIALFEEIVHLQTPTLPSDRQAAAVEGPGGTTIVTAVRHVAMPRPDFDVDIDGQTVRLTLNEAALQQRMKVARQTQLDILQRRVQELGTSFGITITPVGSNRIVIEAPAPDMIRRLTELMA